VFTEILLSDELRDYVPESHSIGMSSLKIQLALDARGISLSSAQIHNISRPAQVSAFGDSSAELINYVTNSGGRVAI
jgi:hypothetical protein